MSLSSQTSGTSSSHSPAQGTDTRTSTSPPATNLITSDSSSEDEPIDYHEPNEPLELDPTFSDDSEFPGTIKISVEDTIFWVHKEILYFSSPFFKAALSGGWLETTRPASVASSIITISQPPSVPAGSTPLRQTHEPAEIRHNSAEITTTNSDILEDSDILTSSDDEEQFDSEQKEKDRHKSYQILEGLPLSKPAGWRPKIKPLKDSKDGRKTVGHKVAEAFIQLKDEKASTFQDFLKFVYPQLHCIITWNNVEGLTNIARKLVVPELYRHCISFLFSHAAGKPIKALRIAELFDEEELYVEASRYVLDNSGDWPEADLQTLSKETLLKLEKSRVWFLERVLKLSLVPIAREYPCCPTCPDPFVCARLLDEKFKSGVAALSRFGTMHPSMVFRYLHDLDGPPPFALTNYQCQRAAKAFVASLFGRMFSLSLLDQMPDFRISRPTGPKRHFLYCKLYEKPRKHKKDRTQLLGAAAN